MTLLVKTSDRNFTLGNRPGATLADLLHAAGILLNQRCGGAGNCGGCTIVMEEGGFAVGGRTVYLAADRPRDVRACQTHALGDHCVIRVPSRSQLAVDGPAIVDFDLPVFAFDPRVRRLGVAVAPPSLADARSDQERLLAPVANATGVAALRVPLSVTRALPGVLQVSAGGTTTATLAADDDGCWWVLGVQAGAPTRPPFGVALDIGTTTVAGILVDLSCGAIVGRSTRYNQQLTLADDVAARISGAGTASDLERMRRLVVSETINPIIDSLCHAQHIDAEDVCHLAVAGNTVMVHLLLGLPVANIGRLPFNAVLRDAGLLAAGELGIRGHRLAPVSIIPAIAGYVGGDISAGMYALGLPSRPDGALMVDVGTNCEMVFKQGAELLACATPAGPAFEGGGLLHGCRATDGAIAHVRIGADLQISVDCIGDRDPIGICGSGVIDFIAEAYRCGLLNRAGRMDVALLQRHARYACVTVKGRPVHACVLAPGAPGQQGGVQIAISEADIAEVLKAKAAIHAGIQTLLSTRGLTPHAITQLILAGGFARHIDIDNAVCIGLLPDLPRDRIHVAGNTALAGAYLTLVDASAGAAMRTLHTRPKVVELNLVQGFEANFIDSLFLPLRPRAACNG